MIHYGGLGERTSLPNRDPAKVSCQCRLKYIIGYIVLVCFLNRVVIFFVDFSWKITYNYY